MKLSYILAICIICLVSVFISDKVWAESSALSCSDPASLYAKISGLKLIPNASDHFEFFITSSATMPSMKFAAEVTGDLSDTEKSCLYQNLQTNFDWSLRVEYWDGVLRNEHKILSTKLGAQRSGLSTNDGWTYAVTKKAATITITPQDLGGKFGGGADGAVTVNLHVGDKTFTATSPLQIWADSVDKTEIKLYLGDLKYQLLGYLESKFIQIYNGTALINCGDETCSVSDGGFGLMQITDCSGAAGTLHSIPGKAGTGHGFPSYQQIWSWKANADAGKSCYDMKLKYLCSKYAAGSDAQLKCSYSGYNGSSSYGELGITILNEMRNGRFRAGWF